MRDLLLFAIMVGLVPVILMRPWIGVPAWFWVGLMYPHRNTWSFMHDFPIAQVIGGVTLVALVIAKDRQRLPMTRETVFLILFTAYVTMTTAFAINPTAWDVWQHLMKILLITYITPMLIYGRQRIYLVLLVIAFSIAFYGFKGGLFAISTGGAHHVLGPRNSYLNGNTSIGLAMLMVLPLVLVSARAFYNRWVDLGWAWLDRWYRPIGLGMYAVFWLTAIAILATHSRGAFLGALLIAPFMFWHMRRKLVMVTLAFLLVGVLGFTVPERLAERWQTIETYEEDTSSMQRIQAWGVNWNMAMERPILGMGFRHAGVGYNWWVSYANFEGTWDHALSAHSIYFQVLGHHGFGGLAVFLTLIAFTMLTLNRVQRQAKHRPGQLWLSEYAWAIQVGMIAFLGAGAFLDVAYFNLFYAFIALAVIMRRELDYSTKSASDRVAEPAEERTPAGTVPVAGMGNASTTAPWSSRSGQSGAGW